MTGPMIRIYDFKRPEIFSKDDIRFYESLFDNAARLLADLWGDMCGADLSMDANSVDSLLMDEFYRSIPEKGLCICFADRDGQRIHIFEIAPSLYRALMDLLFGGAGDGEDRTGLDVTIFEEELFTRLAAPMAKVLDQVWQDGPGSFSFTGICRGPAGLRAVVDPREMSLLGSFDARFGRRQGMVNCCLPAYSLPKRSAPGEGNQGGGRIVPELVETDYRILTDLDPISLAELDALAPGAELPMAGLDRGEAYLEAGGERLFRLDLRTGRGAGNGSTLMVREIRHPVVGAGGASEKMKGLASKLGRIEQQIGALAAGIHSGAAGMGETPGGDPGRWMETITAADPYRLARLLGREQLQLQAALFLYLPAGYASILLQALPAGTQGELVKRVAAAGSCNPDALELLLSYLHRKLLPVMAGVELPGAAPGMDRAVELLTSSSREMEERLIRTLEAEEPELAEELKKRFFLFEDIILLDDRSVQKLLRETDTAELAIALKGASEEVREKIYRNMSKRAGEMVKEEGEYMGPVQKERIEESRERIVGLIRRLEDQGEIVVVRGRDDFLIP